MSAGGSVSIVLLTHNRVHELAGTLQRLEQLPERPRIIVVDNASSDGTANFLETRLPATDVVHCPVNLGAAGRNAGVARVETPYVAFCDDDTCWATGSLAHAASILDRYPRVGAVAARILVGDDERLDPNCARLAASPLPGDGLPGPRLVAFMAGAVVMRTDAYREVEGYEPRLFLGAEEMLIALDLAARNWQIVYAHDVVTHHSPSPQRDPTRRERLLIRNRTWIAWMRLPLQDALQTTSSQLRKAAAGGFLLESLFSIGTGAAWVLRHRHVVPSEVAANWRRVLGAEAAPRRPGGQPARDRHASKP